MARETNDEARMTNNETNPNEQIIGPVLNAFGVRRMELASTERRIGKTGDQTKRERASQKPKMFRPSSFDIRISSLIKFVSIRVHSWLMISRGEGHRLA